MSTAILTIVDETLSGDAISELTVTFEQPTVTVQDIITSRVEQEVHLYNEKLTERFFGLVRPSEAEESLNGTPPGTAHGKHASS